MGVALDLIASYTNDEKQSGGRFAGSR